MIFSYSLWVAIVAHVVAQSLKPVFEKWKNGDWDWSLLFSSGKLPSSHTATVTALALRIGIDWGFNSVGFAISFIFGSIVIADATGVRQEVGKHAKYINEHIKNGKIMEVIAISEMKELVGHTLGEVLGGLIVGITIVAISLLFSNPY
ncbi:MAG: divergent PAP2 family protein [Caldisericia bacterium]|nr:divergent PAP2 family protein [Caldisericia bacterium]